ncbi:MAG: hypothetical protein GY906_19835 [bacterium]|nr:hypothetical protein [bacterium]
MASRRLILPILFAGALLIGVPAEGSGRIATLSSIVVDDSVEGDVIAIGGDIELRPGAKVDGHVVAVFGSVTRSPGAYVGGRTLAVSSLASLNLEPENGRQNSSLTLAVRLLTVGGWLLATTVLAMVLPYRMRHGAMMMRALGFRVLVLGAAAFVTLIAALVAMLGLGPKLGVPLAVAVMLVFVAAKAVGLTVIGAHFGSAILVRVSKRHFPLTIAVFLGVLVMAAVRFIPVVGGLMWTGLSVAALGAGVFAVAFVPGREEARVLVRSSGSSSR